MYKFNIIDESEYKLCEHDNNIWKYSRVRPVNRSKRNNGNCFIYKNTLRNEDVYFGEVVGSRIAKATIGNACTAELARKYRPGTNGIYDNGVISYFYFSDNDKPISLHYILDQYYLKENIGRKSSLRKFPTIVDIVKALKYYMLQKTNRPYSEYESLRQQYIDMIMFDCRFGNYDRTLDNWLLYRDLIDKKISLYPLFDNEAVLGFDEPVNEYHGNTGKIIQYCQEQRMRYIVPGEEFPQCSTPGNIVKYLLRKYPKEIQISLEKVNSFSLSDLLSLLDEFPDMSDDRKKFACKMFYARKLLFERYQKEAMEEQKDFLYNKYEKEIII